MTRFCLKRNTVLKWANHFCCNVLVSMLSSILHKSGTLVENGISNACQCDVERLSKI